MSDMFKQGSIADEISCSMERELVAHQAEKTHGFSKVAKAIELLGNTATLFAQAGMTEEEREVIGVLESLVKEMEQK